MSSLDPGSTPPPVPAPVRALPYSVPMQYGRPGIITAIGVMCIVVACLSGITSFGTGVYSFGFFFISKTMSAVSRASAPSTAAPIPPAALSAGGLPAGDVGVAVNTLREALSLDARHVRELDRLLRLHGRDVFDGDDDTRLTAASVKDEIAGTLTPAGAGDAPAQFSTSKGTVKIYSDRASFKLSDGTLTIETSVRHDIDQTATPATSSAATTTFHYHVSNASSTMVVPAAPTTLTRTQIAFVVAAVKSTNPSLNASQIAGLQTALASPNQTLVTPAAAMPGGYPVLSAFAQPNGNATIMFNTGSNLVLGPQGQVISSGPPPMPKFNISTTLVAVLIGESIGSIALAIYLLVVGIQVFRASFQAQRLLRIYAWLKIPLAITAGVGISLLAYQFAIAITGNMAMSGAPTSSAPAATAFIIWGAVIALLGAAFPIALLIALRSRTVRGYYNAVLSVDR